MTDAAGKPRWERWLAVAAILVPASIALAGHLIGRELKQAEISAQDRRDDLNRELTRAQLRISQAGVINTLMPALTSVNPQTRRLAVGAVLVAIPEDGPALARIVAESDEDKDVKVAAKASLSSRFDQLLQAMYGSDSSTRVQSARELIRWWQGDSDATRAILNYAEAHLDNQQGTFNTVVVLTDFILKALSPHKPAILRFAEKARTNGPKTGAQLDALLRKISAS